MRRVRLIMTALMFGAAFAFQLFWGLNRPPVSSPPDPHLMWVSWGVNSAMFVMWMMALGVIHFAGYLNERLEDRVRRLEEELGRRGRGPADSPALEGGREGEP